MRNPMLLRPSIVVAGTELEVLLWDSVPMSGRALWLVSRTLPFTLLLFGESWEVQFVAVTSSRCLDLLLFITGSASVAVALALRLSPSHCFWLLGAPLAISYVLRHTVGYPGCWLQFGLAMALMWILVALLLRGPWLLG